VAFSLAAPRAGLLAAAAFLVHGSRGAAFGFLLAGTAVFVAFFNVFGLAPFFVCRAVAAPPRLPRIFSVSHNCH
jgi:hypothetical protein